MHDERENQNFLRLAHLGTELCPVGPALGPATTLTIHSTFAPISSISQRDQEYLTVCQQAVLPLDDPHCIPHWKQDARYQRILEHVSKGQGEQYLRCLTDSPLWPAYAQQLPQFLLSDTVGSPHQETFILPDGQNIRVLPLIGAI